MSGRTKQAQNLRRMAKSSGMTLRDLVELVPMKRDGKPVLKIGTLARFLDGKLPSDKIILYALGLYTPRRISEQSPDELLWRLENRKEVTG